MSGDDTDDYLEANPHSECALFMDWFHTVCGWEKVTPTPQELADARAGWYPGQAPRTAVDSMLRKRKSEAAE
jgi:hypothetical protein